MADFVAVLRKTLGGMQDPSEEIRARVYAKARETIGAKLASMNPKPPQAMIDRQMQALEEAISEVEAGYLLTDLDFGEEAVGDLLLEDIDPTPAPAPAPAPSRASPLPPSRPAPPPDPVAGPAHPPARSAARHEPDFDEGRDEDADLVGIDSDDDVPPVSGRREGHAAANDWDEEDEDFAPPRRGKGARRKRGAIMPALLSLVALLILAGAAYGVWHYRDTIIELAGDVGFSEDPAQPEVVEEEPQAATEVAAATSDATETRKFTQRLLEDGSEVDPGPAGEAPRIGEGTSVASASNGELPPAAGSALPVGQKAIFYEERTNSLQGSADPGEVLWSLVEESPGAGLPPEPAIRAEASIPAKDLQFRMTIRRNADESLPASHIIEIIFLVPEDFDGGAVDNILRVAFKDSEQAPGNPLLGLPAKISDGFFLLALSDSKAELDANVTMMRRLDWLDIPIVYRSGRRALITLEKGIPGARVFEDALAAWSTDNRS